MRFSATPLLANSHVRQFVKYVGVGGVNTLVIFGLFFLFNDLAGVGPVWANRIGYAGGLVSNFTLNKLWTFRAHKFRLIEIALFLAAFAVSYGIQFLCFMILMDEMGWREGLAALVAYPLYGTAFFLQCKFIVFNPNLGIRT